MGNMDLFERMRYGKNITLSTLVEHNIISLDLAKKITDVNNIIRNKDIDMYTKAKMMLDIIPYDLEERLYNCVYVYYGFNIGDDVNELANLHLVYAVYEATGLFGSNESKEITTEKKVSRKRKLTRKEINI